MTRRLTVQAEVGIVVNGQHCSPDCAFVSAVASAMRTRLVWCWLFDEKLYGDGTGLRCEACLAAEAAATADPPAATE